VPRSFRIVALAAGFVQPAGLSVESAESMGKASYHHRTRKAAARGGPVLTGSG